MTRQSARTQAPLDKPSGGAPAGEDRPRTYQEALDEALTETFPASDPISPSTPRQADEPLESSRDAVDWPLPSSESTDRTDAVEQAGTHPIGGTLGAVAGAAAGAVIGIAAGPVGSLAGAAMGAAAGTALGAGGAPTEGPPNEQSDDANAPQPPTRR